MNSATSTSTGVLIQHKKKPEYIDVILNAYILKNKDIQLDLCASTDVLFTFLTASRKYLWTMEYAHQNRAFTEQSKNRPTGRVLAVTSGNKRAHPNDSKVEFAERKHHDPPKPVFSNNYADHPYPPPRATLTSNDHGASLRQTLARRRLWQRMNTPRPYLTYYGYLEYRTSGRRDTCRKSGEEKWPDHIEDAFQNAVVFIPPMGKKKKSQHGKPHGRNELISEWIYHETGEVRQRKQVSSHFQVLDKKMMNIPEWRAVRMELDNVCKLTEAENADYYFNSVEDVVREVRTMKAESRLLAENGVQEVMTMPMYTPIEKYHVQHLEFGMWVSLPHKMEEVLHQYTTLDCNLPERAAAPLEELSNWRFSFPDLVPVIDTVCPSDDFDIVCVNASLRLMDDFPPASSKLGISLGLEFSDAHSNPIHPGKNYKDWNCTTHVYQQGEIIHTTATNKCPISGLRTIKPPFESKWWAYEFTRLTSERQRAQDTGDHAAMTAADESTRDFLRGLSVMQQVCVTTGCADDPYNIWGDGPVRYKRMAILLWTFSEAPAGEAGVATWQKLIPQPKEESSCYGLEHPYQSMLVGDHPLVAADPGGVESRADESFLGELEECQYIDISADGRNLNVPNEQFCHDGFVIVNQTAPYNNSRTILENDSTNMRSLSSSFDMVDRIDTSLHTHSFHDYPPLHGNNLDSQSMLPSNYFEHESQPAEHGNESQYQNTSQDDAEMSGITNLDSHRLPLANFNLSTHEMLQEQLGVTNNNCGSGYENIQSTNHPDSPCMAPDKEAEIDEEALKDALVAASVVNCLEDFEHTSQPDKSLVIESVMSPPEFLAPVAIRPPLQQHHSFTGVFPSQPLCDLEVPRYDFTHMLAKMEASQDFCFIATEPPTEESPHELVRAQSQPQFSTKQFKQYEPMLENQVDAGYVEIIHEEIQTT